MKSQKVKNEALELYVGNVSIYQISKQIDVSQPTLNKWRTKDNWDELKEQTLKKVNKKLCEKIVSDQKGIVDTAQSQLKDKLSKQDEISTHIAELWLQIKELDPKQDKDERAELFSMLNPLLKQLFEVKDLIAVMKHGLEVVRPKQTTNNLNITKNENTAIQVVIPKEVEELLTKNGTN